jgi:WD40 repeat protein
MKMLASRRFLMLVLPIFLSACFAVKPTPAPTVTAPQMEAPPAAMNTVAPTKVTIPTPNPLPVATPEPSLATGGPYLLYRRIVNNQVQLVLMDANGLGRKTLPLPPEITHPDSENAATSSSVFPDGKWLAFYTGSPEDKNLALNLMELATGQTQIVTALLPKNYPDNFITNAEAALKAGDLGQLDIQFYDSAEKLAPDLKNAFLAGIHTLAWSPDGRSLAFAGAMDGPSSDLYLYDLETQTIRRMSDGPEEIRWIEWSPDGQWIMHGSNYYTGAGETYTTHAAALDGSVVKTLSQSPIGVDEWLDSHTFIQHNGANGPGAFQLESVDILTGNRKMLWDGSFYAYDIDKINHLLLISAWTSSWPETAENFGKTGGLFLLNLASGSETRLIGQPHSTRGNIYPEIREVTFLGMGDKRFVASYEKQTSFYVFADGSLTPTEGFIRLVSVAPDGQHWLAFGEKTLQVMAADGSVICEANMPFQIGPYDRILWRPDSTGIFFVNYTDSAIDLYAIDLLDGLPRLVDRDASQAYPAVYESRFSDRYQWIAPK